VADYRQFQFDSLYLAIGKRILAARNAQNVTQQQLATAIGLSRSAIANIESGRQHPPLHVLLMAATELDLTLAELLAVDNTTGGTLVVKLLAESAQSRKRAYAQGWDACAAAMRQAVRTVATTRECFEQAQEREVTDA
jgi:transcriptional regulator with XRE-family HTH domain